MEIAGAVVGAVIIGLAIYWLVKVFKDDEKEPEPEPIPPFIESFSVSPHYICSSGSNSCGTTIAFSIGGDFKPEEHSSSLTLVRGTDTVIICRDETSFNRQMSLPDFAGGPGEYKFVLRLNEETETGDVTVFRERGTISHKVQAIADKDDQNMIYASFTVGPPGTGADYEVCMKVMYLDAIELTDLGTANEPVFVTVGSQPTEKLNLGDRYPMPGQGLQITQGKVVVQTSAMQDESFQIGETRHWVLALHFHC